MRLCSQGGEMADIEQESTSRKDFKMDSNSILKPAPVFLLGNIHENKEELK